MLQKEAVRGKKGTRHAVRGSRFEVQGSGAKAAAELLLLSAKSSL